MSKDYLKPQLKNVCPSVFNGRRCSIFNMCVDVVKHHPNVLSLIPIHTSSEIHENPQLT